VLENSCIHRFRLTGGNGIAFELAGLTEACLATFAAMTMTYLFLVSNSYQTGFPILHMVPLLHSVFLPTLDLAPLTPLAALPVSPP